MSIYLLVHTQIKILTNQLLIFPPFSYALFPLLLLLDAAVESRSLPKHDAKESCVSGPPGVSHKVSDVVAEGVLRCLEELLRKCPLGSTDQVVYYKISLYQKM